ncbi:MAG: hypothetical protein JJE45_00960 [Prolixibacteraceae bacterium]|nr:hypothetical protein [Prolixibacteraceae bacterium]
MLEILIILYMVGFLRIILFILIIYYVIKIINILLISRFKKKFKDNSSSFRKDNRTEGDVRVEGEKPKNSGSFGENGEYVDYEEIKDEKRGKK